MTLPPKIFKKFILTFVTLFSIFGLLGGTLFILFETPKGQKFLLTSLQNYLKKEGVETVLEGLEGDFPKNFTIQKISLITDLSTGEFFTIENLKIRLTWKDLLKGALTFEEITAQNVDLCPLTSSSPPTSSFSLDPILSVFNSLSLPSIPLSISLKKLTIEDLSFKDDHNVLHFHAKGGFHIPYFLSISQSTFFLNIEGANVSTKVFLEGLYEVPSGILRGTLNIQEGPKGIFGSSQPFSLKASFRKEPSLSLWKGEVDFKEPTFLEFIGGYTLSLENVPKLSLKGSLCLLDLFENFPFFLSPNFQAEGDLSLKGHNVFFDTFSMKNEDILVQGFGSFPLNEAPFHMQGSLDILNLDPFKNFSLPSFRTFEKMLPKTLSFELTGTFEETLHLTCHSQKSSTPSFHFDLISALTLKKDFAEGEIKVSMPFEGIPLEGAFHMYWRNNTFYIKDLLITGGHIRLQGNMDWGKTPLPTGSVSFSLEDLDLLSPDFPKGHFSGKLESHEKKGLLVDLEGKNILYDTLSLDYLRFKASAETLKGKGTKIACTFKNLSQDNFRFLETLKLDGTGDLEKKEPSFHGKIHLHNADFPLSMDSDFEVFQKNNLSSLSFSSFKGKLHGQKISLSSPLSLTLFQNGFSLPSTTLFWGKAKISFSFDAKGESIAGNLTLKNFSLPFLTPFHSFFNIPICLNGTTQLKGTRTHPSLTLNMDLDSAPTMALFEESSEHFKGNLSGSWDGKVLHLLLDCKDTKTTDRLHGVSSLPLVLENGHRLFFSQTSPLALSLKGEGSLETLSLFLFPFLTADGDLLKGDISLALEIVGTLKKKLVSGFVSLQNGQYQNLKLGTIFENIALKIQGTGDRFQILQGSAQDPKKGTLHLTGWFSQTFSEDGPQSYNLAADFSNFQLTALDLLTAQGSGILNLTKSHALLPSLTGQLTLSPISVQIPKKFPSSIVVLPFKRKGNSLVNREEARAKSSLFLSHLKKEDLSRLSIIALHPPVQDDSKLPKSFIPNLPLNIEIDIPPRFSVEGRGLSSLWGGKITLGGTLEDPKLHGALLLHRGKFSLFGKVFSITQGTLFFRGDSNIDPDVNITAQITTADIVAHVIINGELTSPQFTLKSQPNLPPGEITSRILFGKSIGSLTPMQSLQIASALGDLTGTRGPLGFVDEIRDSLGLGALSFTSGDKGGAGVDLGNFLSDNVSFNLSPDLTNNSAQATIEVKVLPNVTVQSAIDTQSAGGGGVNWQWDYD